MNQNNFESDAWNSVAFLYGEPTIFDDIIEA